MATTTVQKRPVFFDPMDPMDISPHTEIPPIQASMTARVWEAGKCSVIGGVLGLGAVCVLGAVFDPRSKDDKDGSPVRAGLAGGAMGVLMGLGYFVSLDNRVHFELQASYVGCDDALRTSALKKANYIFKAYAAKMFESQDPLFDSHFEYNLFIYPVEAEDGKIYEHSDICRFVTENYAAALQNYEQLFQRYPDDPDLTPPSPSPARSGNVRLGELRLHCKTMKQVSGVMADFFKKLRGWEALLQAAVDEQYQESKFSLFSAQQKPLTKEQIEAVDEVSLARKVYRKEPLFPEEVFIIRQLFYHYIVEIRERDDRIYIGISEALGQQLRNRVITPQKHMEEMQALHQWYAYAKELYV